MSSTLDDFFGDGSEESIPECSFCGDKEGELIVSIQDAYGPTHWHHAACEAADGAKKGTPLTPTWDEAMEIMINDPLIEGHETQAEKKVKMQGRMREVTIEQGPINTVKFIRQPREEGRSAGKVSVIMFDHEIPGGDVEATRSEFQADWKVAVRKFDLIVDKE